MGRNGGHFEGEVAQAEDFFVGEQARVVLRAVIGRLPSPAQILETVESLTDVVRGLAKRCDARGRPPKGAVTDGPRWGLAECVAPLMPCILHDGKHEADTCGPLREGVALEIVERLRSRSRAGVVYRGKAAVVEVMVCADWAASASRLLAALLEVAREAVRDGWQDVVARLIENRGQATKGIERKVRLAVEARWLQPYAPIRSEEEFRLRLARRRDDAKAWGTVSSRIVREGQSYVQRGSMKHIPRRSAEALSKALKRFKGALKDAPVEEYRRAYEQAYEKGRRPGGRLVMKQKWDYLHSYLALVAQAWLAAQKDAEGGQPRIDLQPSWEGGAQELLTRKSAKAQGLRVSKSPKVQGKPRGGATRTEVQKKALWQKHRDYDLQRMRELQSKRR
jgi:hypothetical protein